MSQNDTDKLAAYLLRYRTRPPFFAILLDPKVSILTVVNTIQSLDQYLQGARKRLQFDIEPG